MTSAELLDPSVSVCIAEQSLFGERLHRIVGRVQPSDGELLERIALSLELATVTGCLLEMLASGSKPTVDDLSAATGFDAGRTLLEGRRAFGEGGVDPEIEPTLEDMLRIASGALHLFPVEQVQDHAVRVGRPDVSHRLRVAYDALAAFVYRHDPRHQRQVRAVGEGYRQGRFSIDEAAAFLEMDQPDTLALLESAGYAQPLGEIRLSDEQRAEALRRIRADRKARGGRQESGGHVARSVIASERLEGVDARPWIRKTGR